MTMDQTPPESIHPAIMAHMSRLSAECDGRHERIAGALSRVRAQQEKHHDLLIEMAGRSGKNGKLGELGEDMTETRKAMLAIQRKQDLMGVKLALLVAGAAGLATVAGGIFVKLVIGV